MKARTRISRSWSTVFVVLIFSVLPAVAGAHHSRAEFSDDVLEIEGDTVEVGWRNPHPVITVESVDDTGLHKRWMVESWQSANSLERNGVPDVLPLTEAAAEQAASFDELRDHPQWYCQPEGMPLVMDSVYPIEFTDHGDRIGLHLERTDATRTIHMRAGASSENQAPVASRTGVTISILQAGNPCCHREIEH